MMGKKVLLTYKRKRFSSQSHHGKGVTADLSSKSPTGILLEISSQEAESGADNEKLNKENTHCSSCGSVDVNENLLGCIRCLRSYHLRCIDPLSKYIPQEKWHCSACIKSHEFEESMQQQVQETNENKTNKSIEESELGPIELHSHKMLLHTRPPGDSSTKTSSSTNDTSFKKIKNIIQTDESYADSGSACEVTCAEGSLSSKIIDLEIVGRSNSICLDSLTERKSSSGFPEDCVSVLLHSDKRESFLCNEQRPKENCSTPLITFYRRLRKKHDTGEKCVGGNLRAEEIRCSTGSWSKIGPSCRCEGSIPECSFMDHSTKSVLPEQADCRPLHVVQQALMADVWKDAGVESAHASTLATTNAGDTGDKLSLQCSHIPEKPNLSHQYPLPSQPAGHVPEDPSGKLAAAHTTDVIRDSIIVHGCRGLVSLGNKLVGTTNSSEKAIMLHGVSKDRSHLSDLEFSIAPPASNGLTRIKSSKSASSVMPENLLESQSSLAQSCGVIMADKETDGKVDELKWLETLDKEPQDMKQERSICSSLEQSVINCEQASNGRASSMLPVGSSVKSRHDQDAYIEFKNQITGSRDTAYLTKSVETGSEEQRHEETTNKSSFSTDFLGLLLNSEGPDVSIKDFQSMHSSLNFSIKDSVHEYNRRFPWPSIGVNASLSKQKQIVDNILTGSLMLEKRQAPLLDKFKRNANEWSEEELDFLWIGVRRYGVNNWNAMLRDPKLCFVKSRVAEDLAERWNLEQRKLLNGAVLQPGRLSVPDLSLPPFMNDSWLAKPSSSNHYGGNGAWSACSEFPMLTAEPKLSLGDKNEIIFKRNPLHSLGLCPANPLTSVSPPADSILCSFPAGSSYPGSGLDHHKSFNVHNTRYDCESSSSHQKSVERLTQDHQTVSLPASNLPHWLRDVLIPKPKPSNSTLPPVSALAQSASMLGKDTRVEPTAPPAPPKDSRGRGILKRKNITSGNHASVVRVSERLVSVNEHQMGKRPGALPTLGANSQVPSLVNTGSGPNGVSNLNKNSGPGGPSNLVVIDSDASSEETISDS